MKKQWTLITLFIVFSIILAGCNYPGRATPTSQVDAMNTAAAQTIQAQQTGIVQTSQAQSQTTPTVTLSPSDDVTATTAPQNTSTLTPTRTTEGDCYSASLVSETIPDGTDMTPGESFTKTWTLKNTGACQWTSDFDVVFTSGDAMNAPASLQLTNGTVSEGQSVQIKIDLKAPNAAGTHRGEFKLRNANGLLFGLGAKDGPFWVEVDVAGTLYDFADKYCASGVTWTSGAGTLPCPGTVGDSEGWVIKDNSPKLENGVTENEAGLITHPQAVNDGWIRGTYPEITITSGVYFKSIVGCNGSEDCDVRFKLNYKVDGGAEQTLATWHEVQDNAYTRVKVDLSSLEGKQVQFILLVQANGSSSNDQALWLAPRIEP
ncbi:MAG: NBR1-Ig-like domain-containing protein [Chloroflexota bacterium]|nr:NBR1-Ig-like domain-containing protein [Chloroflexota bacterium]